VTNQDGNGMNHVNPENPDSDHSILPLFSLSEEEGISRYFALDSDG
jgi:hypothetical protein